MAKVKIIAQFMIRVIRHGWYQFTMTKRRLFNLPGSGETIDAL